MNIRFTKHALQKFGVLQRHGMLISKQRVVQAVHAPEYIDYRRLPLLVAQRSFSRTLVLRVVYRFDEKEAVVITFYPGKKSQYGKK